MDQFLKDVWGFYERYVLWYITIVRYLAILIIAQFYPLQNFKVVLGILGEIKLV